MAKFGFKPLAEWSGRTYLHQDRERLIHPVWDAQTQTLTATLRNGDAIASVSFGPNGPLSAYIVLTSAVDPAIVGRINRLMQGTNAPKVETYSRGGGALNGQVVVRLPGRPVPVPVAVAGSVGASGWTWSRMSGGAQAAPSAPVQTPTPAPEPTAPAPTVAPTVPSRPPVAAPIKVNAPKVDPLGLLRFPSKATTHDVIASDEVRRRLQAFMARHLSKTREGMSAMLLTGPAGTGKTQMVDYLAREYGFGVFDANAMGAMDLSDWAGRTGVVAENGTMVTRFNWTSLIEVIRADGPYGDTVRAVKVDEFNRTPSTAASNFWLPVIEEGRIYVPEAGVSVDISRNVIFFFTVNEGAGYSGTVDIDTAIRDRMDANVRLDYLAPEVEAALVLDRWGRVTNLSASQAAQVVSAARAIRDLAARREVRMGVSTRNILKAVEQVQYGLTLREACMSIWADAYPDVAQRERVITAINASIAE